MTGRAGRGSTPRGGSASLVLDVYGAYVRELGGWIAIADLITLLAELGADAQAVRTAVSRFTQRGLLARRKVRGRVGYELTAAARRILAEGDERIFERTTPTSAADGWVLVAFSLPEPQRAERHQLRSRLTWLGFGSLGGGVWIAPRRVLPRTLEAVTDLGLEDAVDVFTASYEAFRPEAHLFARCWDPPAIAAAYERFLAASAPVQLPPEGAVPDPLRAFVDYTLVLHEWRKLPHVDPGLPRELLPDDWIGTTAAERFAQLRSRLEPAAHRHVRAVVEG